MGVGAVVLWLVALAAAPPGELIGNGAFERDATGWHFWYSPGQAVGAAQWVAREPGGALRVAVERRDTPSAVQIYHGPFAVRQGQRYLLRFQARATQPFGLTVKLMEHETPYRALGLDAEVPLTRDWRTYSLLAVGRLDSEQGRLDFMPAGSFELDEVSLLPAPPAALGPP
ncbi:MAG: carbohydrate binding domain-containing protein, partial [Armatimonadetes bacterium]|nr:carbohydrate binding domain-containing protein [Armatimonadota bacterium]